MEDMPILFATLKDGRCEAIYHRMGYGYHFNPNLPVELARAKSGDLLALNDWPYFMEEVMFEGPRQVSLSNLKRTHYSEKETAKELANLTENIEYAISRHSLDSMIRTFPVIFEKVEREAKESNSDVFHPFAQKIAELLSDGINEAPASVNEIYPKFLLKQYSGRSPSGVI